MKKYESPVWQLILLSAEPLMASDDNELAIDKLASIFGFN